MPPNAPPYLPILVHEQAFCYDTEAWFSSSGPCLVYRLGQTLGIVYNA